MTLKRLAVLVSGRGSNFAAVQKAIMRGELDAEIVAVISNRPEAPAIANAAEWGLPAHIIDHRSYDSRESHESAVLEVLAGVRPDWIVLAGYMRLLSARFVSRYPYRIVNIHPSLLPAFPGVDAQAQAIAHGVKVSGCTVHFVDEHLDAGPIIVQRAVEVRDEDTPRSLAARILEQEHLAYVEALRKISGGTFRIEGRRVKFGRAD